MRNMKNRRIDRALRIDRPENRNNDERARSSFVTFPLTETETPVLSYLSYHAFMRANYDRYTVYVSL